MNFGAGTTFVIRWVMTIAVVGSVSGCNALDRGRLDRVVMPPAAGDNGHMDPPPSDGGVRMDSSVPMDSGVRMDGGVRMDSGAPIDSSTPIDTGVPTEAGADASDDAAIDAGCITLECMDLCPDDPNKTAPGACGCGADETRAAECTALHSALRHRYRFEGTGTLVTDDVSDADGTVINATLDDSSTLTLAGGTTNQHVELPDGIISALTDATFEVWLNWQGGAIWQRVFDFGSSSGSSGETYVFVTPQRGGGSMSMRATFSLAGTASEVVVDDGAALTSGTLHHLALVVDDRVELRLYLDGVLQSTTPNTTRSLSDLNDIQNWLGRSQYSVDAELGGTYHEFRIYEAALSDAQIAASFALGPDPAFLE